MNNTRFATAVHILSVMAVCPNEWLTSEVIAGSANVNPVVVRKEILVLKEAGLVESRKGKEGGSQLAKSPKEIFLSEVFLAVKSTELLGKKNQNPNPNCPVGKVINQKLDHLYQAIDSSVLESLKKISLDDFIHQKN